MKDRVVLIFGPSDYFALCPWFNKATRDKNASTKFELNRINLGMLPPISHIIYMQKTESNLINVVTLLNLIEI